MMLINHSVDSCIATCFRFSVAPSYYFWANLLLTSRPKSWYIYILELMGQHLRSCTGNSPALSGKWAVNIWDFFKKLFSVLGIELSSSLLGKCTTHWANIPSRRHLILCEYYILFCVCWLLHFCMFVCIIKVLVLKMWTLNGSVLGYLK